MFDIRHGDCREVLKQLPDCSVDSIVTDPPYELGFMGKAWDSTGVAYQVEVWQECLRVLKVGGHLLAFGGSRTYHRLACAIEDAGFQIRDQIMWVYGSGFPKSLNISKAIDKSAGAEREVVSKGMSGKTAIWQEEGGMGDFDITAPATAEAKQWEGWGTALKPAHEPIVMARKPLVGTVAQTVLTHGTGGINIDGCRVGRGNESDNRFKHRFRTAMVGMRHKRTTISGGNGSLDVQNDKGWSVSCELYPRWLRRSARTIPTKQRWRIPKEGKCADRQHYEGGWGAVITVHEQRWAMVLLHGSFIVRKPARRIATKV
jgi:hypothetical protein